MQVWALDVARTVGRMVAFGMLLATVGGSQAHAQPRTPVRTFTLSSPAFADGGLIPDAHAQPGRDLSPPLSWSGAPDSTRSFLLVVHDPDAPVGDGTDDLLHWLVWNIPGTATSLPGGMPHGPQRPDGMRQISVSGPYYRGPAAPATGPVHHYVFELYALDISLTQPAVGLPAALTRAALMDAIRGHVRGKGVLVGRYRRSAP